MDVLLYLIISYKMDILLYTVCILGPTLNKCYYKGEKRIGISYSIQNFDSSQERLGTRSADIAVIRMLSNNVKYEILELRVVMDPISNTKKMIPSGTYAGRELLSIVEGMLELNQFAVDDQVIKKDKLKGIMEMIINLNELNNSDNLEDGHPSNTLFMYHAMIRFYAF